MGEEDRRLAASGFEEGPFATAVAAVGVAAVGWHAAVAAF